EDADLTKRSDGSNASELLARLNTATNETEDFRTWRDAQIGDHRGYSGAFQVRHGLAIKNRHELAGPAGERDDERIDTCPIRPGLRDDGAYLRDKQFMLIAVRRH